LLKSRFSCALLVIKPFIALSEYQIACHLSNQPKLDLRHIPVAFFDHTDFVPKLSIFVPEQKEENTPFQTQKIFASNEEKADLVVPFTPVTPVTSLKN